ncbi:MAG: zf-HC2 domain-containing protein [Elusimicrobia bacterium]|nr:zf-HC2 domain-containing protein [Elusimicrobiota bacterium]MDE2510132.1 zf-HC2 domain-containing protein [Elusimicrobiota bacterium]
MEHERIAGKLSEYRDGALSPAERDEVSRHLSGCADCAAELADWGALSAAFLRRPAPPAPFQTEAFVSRVMARLPAESAEPFARLLSRWLAPALGLGFAALAFSFSPYVRDAGLDPAAALISSGAERAGAADRITRPGASVGGDLFGLDPEER